MFSGEKHIAPQFHLYRVFGLTCAIAATVFDAVSFDVECRVQNGFELCVCTDFHGITSHAESAFIVSTFTLFLPEYKKEAESLFRFQPQRCCFK